MRFILGRGLHSLQYESLSPVWITLSSMNQLWIVTKVSTSCNIIATINLLLLHHHQQPAPACQLGTGHHRTSSSRLVIIYNPEKEQSRIHWRGRIRKSLVTKYTLLIHFGMFERLRPPFLRKLFFESVAMLQLTGWRRSRKPFDAQGSAPGPVPSGCMIQGLCRKFEISSKKLEKWLSPKTFWNAPPIILDEPGYFLACSILKGSKKNFGKFWNSESGHGILCFS